MSIPALLEDWLQLKIEQQQAIIRSRQATQEGDPNAKRRSMELLQADGAATAYEETLRMVRSLA